MKARIEKLKLIPENPFYYKAVLERFEGKDIELTIEEWTDLRTAAQNRYLWKYYELIELETGDNAVSLHEVCKKQFLPPNYVTAMGKRIEVVGSTTRLSKKQFSDYIQRIEVATGIYFPYREEL